MHVFGDTHGLKAGQTRRLERLFRRRVPADRLITQELARHLTEASHEIRRQVGVLLDRRGLVQHVMVGDAHSIALPDWGRLRAGRVRLRGLRCVHTHLGNEGLTRDDRTDLLLLRLDAMVTVGMDGDGLPALAYAAALAPTGARTPGARTPGAHTPDDRDAGIECLDPQPPARFAFDFQEWIREREAAFARHAGAERLGDRERAILVSVTAGRRARDLEVHIAELRDLADSAGVEIIDVVTQNRPRVDPRTVLGSGKLDELVIRAFQSDVDLVIVDQDLTPTQARNLGERMELRVIDRTQLILDIFAQHATTRDGKLQVELAQLKYLLPRLAQRADVSLSRLAGGIGGRGPGETQLEVDRRRTRDRVTRLERELKKLAAQRENRRQRRGRRAVPVLSIVGYTNAGKSTLLRALTRTEVHVADQMFATLDPTSRRLRFPREREVVVTDTVGFIRDLPADLVTAFRATLEELADASLLLHVVDAATPDCDRRIEAVRRVLHDICIEAQELLVFNQIDRLGDGEGEALARRHDGVAVSALRSTGLRRLLARAEGMLWADGEGFPSGRGASDPARAALGNRVPGRG